MAVVIRVADNEDDLAAVWAVRRAVFVEEQEIPAELEYDEYDATSAHLLAVGEDGAPLGTARLISGAEALALTGGIAGRVLLGRLAVVPAARGTGLGVRLVRAVEELGREHGATELELHAQVQALGFYERLGYAAHGPEYDDAGIPHRTMTRVL
ncbi:acetyltransferase [Kitasatospora griseola]|uniref:Acetyltransferase n=1 Tax=Kitasatospora griseola TaxID=2064 RepID=A0A0D0NRP4_KITGR|nr:GNAT family N-acetyltransferase [Kitasatospora griseola]KIQ61771.1 acetyltransferase [Kitasatospora griseola]